MFEQLDDPDNFEPGESFFTGTSRRFVTRRRRQVAMRAAGSVLCLAVVAPAFLGAYRSHRVDLTVAPDTDAIGTSPVEPSDPGETSPSVALPADSLPADTFPVADPTAMNFLIIGTDAAPCSGTDARTDTIMVLRLDPARHRAAVLSFPRDLWVKIPGRGSGRINSAYRPNDPQLLIDTLGTEFGVPIDHFIQVDFCAFQKVVDAIGGVKIPMQHAVRDLNTGLSVPAPGCISFTGAEALQYVRSRHFEYLDSATGQWHEDPSSDFGRIARQQDFLRRVLASASSAGVLKPKSINALYAAYRDDLVVDTGMTIAKMIEFVGDISTITPADVRGYQIEATGTIIAHSDVLVWHKDSANMQAILDIFRGTAPLSSTSPATVDSVPAANIPSTAIVPNPQAEC
jgi:LCP family protein required for cell wall assembly